MLDLLKRVVRRKSYKPLNKIEISKRNLVNNLKFIRSLNKDIAIAPVLKSNAYGHGITLVAKVLDELNCPFLCVDSIFEAYQLLNAKIKTPILIMGYVDPSNLTIKDLPFSYVVWDFSQALEIAKYQKQAKFHIFVDTGMNREGVKLEELEELLLKFKNTPELRVEGLMSHLAIYTHNEPYPKLQIENYQKALEISRGVGINVKWVHPAQSGGLLNKYYNVDANMVRSGIAMYGIDRENISKGHLKPILSLKTKIIQIKQISKGTRVGYDSTFEAKKDVVVGVLPIGYNDGVDRRLSNLGVVEVDGVFCPIIGRISMNVTTIDITEVKRPSLGQEVIIFSMDSKDPNSFENAAKLCQTIPHDLLVGLTPSMRREIV